MFQKFFVSVATVMLLASVPANAMPFSFSTGTPDGLIGMATRPASTGQFEIETADDFVLANRTAITSSTFTGLMPANSSVLGVTIEIYRVFPKDSNVARTNGPSVFSTSQVITRVNSPSDVAFDSRDSGGATLSFTTSVLSGSFLSNNSVTPGGIHPEPNSMTGGNGPAAGEEIQFNVTFTDPLNLPADHYFFVPQVQLDNGAFLWLSAPKPITGGTGPFIPDLQAWTRDASLQPDWLRVGTDIVGGTTYNATFSLSGDTAVPEPDSIAIFAAGLAGLMFLGLLKRKYP